nr:MAG TPA: hypothetical protein [Caudoviricetes sp.]
MTVCGRNDAPRFSAHGPEARGICVPEPSIRHASKGHRTRVFARSGQQIKRCLLLRLTPL